jgi:PAS domain S-box-containing protein
MPPPIVDGAVQLTAPATVPARPIFGRPGQRPLLAVVVAAGAALALANAIGSRFGRTEPSPWVADLSLLAATALAGGLLIPVGRGRGSWNATRVLGPVLLGAAGLHGLVLILEATGRIHRDGATIAMEMLPLLLALLVTVGMDFLDHVPKGRMEMLSDTVLVATLVGAALFLVVRLGGAGGGETLMDGLSLATTALAALAFSGWAVLTLWCPSRVHLYLFLSATLLAFSAVMADQSARFASPPGGVSFAAQTAALAILAVAGILIVEPSLNVGEPRAPLAVWWIRPGLLTLSLSGTCILLAATLATDDRIGTESLGLVAAVSAIVGLRMLMGHRSMAGAARDLAEALEEREAAISSLRSASEVIATSEERLRLLLEAAVDGIVEMDPSGTILRANGAFCAMMRMPLEQVVGRRWSELTAVVAARLGQPPDSLDALPSTGEANLVGRSGTTYLEARTSILPTDPPGTLVLVRDVTGRRVAEQTIRTLLHFLQDRDEDRTRLLQRTNAAIEAERNRIARDLHDGPIQGVSAASLSLEAAKLMLESGDVRRALGMLQTIGAELSTEATDLRRLMSDLRPPVLDERGLIPAVRELCGKLSREMEVPVTLSASGGWEVPSDVETLVYRVVQEALWNVGKHAGAESVQVRIEPAGGALRVEIQDNGRGFDPAQTREFLRRGKVGLASMRERAELAGGTFTVKSAPDEGTTVVASIPFDLLSTAPALG